MSFDQPTFEIKGVTFQVEKLNALDGFRTLEKIRKAITSAGLADTLDMDDLNKGQDNAMKTALTKLLEIDPDHVEAVRADLFKKVSFRGNGVEKGWMPLTDINMDMAFQDLPATAIYEVLIRAIAVNFMDCLQGISFPLQAEA